MSLCSASEYGLGCTGFVTADDSLRCKVAPIMPPIGETFYCCPCRRD